MSIGISSAVEQTERELGQVQVYNGSGKGKSQAALGVVLRTIGLGLLDRSARVLIIRFGRECEGEEMASISAIQNGFPGIVDRVCTGGGGWHIAKTAMQWGRYSVVILDDIVRAVTSGEMRESVVCRGISNRAAGVEVICTGEGSPADLLAMADLHTEMIDNPAETPIEGVRIYMGDGKGKSTNGLGTALRALGAGRRVLLLQFMKGGTGYTEDAAIDALRQAYPGNLDHMRSGRDAIVWRGQQVLEDYAEAERSWEVARTAVLSGQHQTVILDELNPVVDLELLPAPPIADLLRMKPDGVQVIITGRSHERHPFFELAEACTEMVCHRHYAENGVALKRGIDY